MQRSRRRAAGERHRKAPALRVGNGALRHLIKAPRRALRQRLQIISRLDMSSTHGGTTFHQAGNQNIWRIMQFSILSSIQPLKWLLRAFRQETLAGWKPTWADSQAAGP